MDVGPSPNGDNTLEFGCDHSDVTVFPFGPAACRDGKDNNCDGTIDKLCFTQCAGSWRFQPTYVTGLVTAQTADLDGDGQREIMVRGGLNMAILAADGTLNYDYSAPNHNCARSAAVFADIDNYGTHGPTIQSLEVLTGDGSRSQLYKLHTDGSVEVFSHALQVYAASTFVVSDIDHAGQPEFVASTWCAANGVELFRFNRATQAIDHSGLKDGLVWENTSGAQTKGFSGGMLVPTRNGEYHFIVCLKSADHDFSPPSPYWNDAPK